MAMSRLARTTGTARGDISLIQRASMPGVMTIKAALPGPEALLRGPSTRRSTFLLGILLIVAQCASAPLPEPPSGAPVAPNESLVTALVLEAVIADSLTLNILPQQRLCVLTLKILTEQPVEDLPNPLHGRSGETIKAYSKELSLVSLKGKTLTVTLSFRGDERGGNFWVQRVR